MRETAVKIATRLGIYQQMMKLDNRIAMRRQNRACKRYGLQMLRLAEEAAEEAGAHLFLAFGSLLGAYREKGFIPFDYDLDTGMLASERNDRFVLSMQARGIELLRQYYASPSGRVAEDKFRYRGVSLDVHYFYPNEDGELYCELCLPHESKPWREANATDGFPSIVRSLPDTTFSKGDFLGVPIYMPDRTEDWLRRLYGEGFMTPNPNWTMGDHKKRAVVSGERLYRRQPQNSK